MMELKKLKLGLPKGSIQREVIDLFKKAGFNIKIKRRLYRPEIDDPEIECFLLRAQEIPRYVESQKLDLGLTGKDLILESKAKIIELMDLFDPKGGKAKGKLVLAIPVDSNINSIKDLTGRIIATEYVNIVKEYLRKNKVKAKVEFSWGSTEVKPGYFTDAMVDITASGITLKAHNLKVLDVLLETSTRLITNKTAWKDKWKREKIKNLIRLLKKVIKS